jgi:uncharacterized OB-fold protein
MSFPEPNITPLNAPYWDALKQGKLLYQHCKECGANWLPAREACPTCLSPDPEWSESAGEGTVESWVVYHTAYDDAFKDRIPYDVTLVTLKEGPRILTNVIDSEAGKLLRVGAAVHLAIQYEGELALARFKLSAS